MPTLLTIFGATGAQGGSLISYILAHPTLSTLFRVRGVTRDIGKTASMALREKGVEMVEVSQILGSREKKRRGAGGRVSTITMPS